MEAALDAFEANPELSVGVLTGVGGVFSAGQDLKAAGRDEFAQTAKRGGFGIMSMSPAMAAGITDRLWSLDDVIAKIDELAPPPAKRGPYKKRGDANSN